jgi:hypothetical protein
MVKTTVRRFSFKRRIYAESGPYFEELTGQQPFKDDKCILSVTEVPFFDHVITSNEIKADP